MSYEFQNYLRLLATEKALQSATLFERVDIFIQNNAMNVLSKIVSKTESINTIPEKYDEARVFYHLLKFLENLRPLIPPILATAMSDYCNY